MIYLWSVSDDYPESFIGQYDRKNSMNRFLLKRGEPLKIDKKPIIHFEACESDLRKFDDLISNAMVPLVSSLVGDILKQKCAHAVQLIPASIRCTDNEITDYSLVNVVHRIKAIDHKLSEYDLVPGTDQIMGFRHLALTSEALGSHQIARDQEYSGNLMVSQDLKTALINSGASGLDFEQPDQS